MLTKTFRAPDMLSALKMVQKDLGANAVIISVRQVPGGPAWQVWHKPMTEVVATLAIPPQGKGNEAGAAMNPKPAEKDAGRSAEPKSVVARRYAAESAALVNEPMDEMELGVAAFAAVSAAAAMSNASRNSPLINGFSAGSSTAAASSTTAARASNPATAAAKAKKVTSFLEYQQAKTASSSPAAAVEMPVLAEKKEPGVTTFVDSSPDTQLQEQDMMAAGKLQPLLERLVDEAKKSVKKFPPVLVDLKGELLSKGLDPALVDKILTTSFETLSPGALADDSRVRYHVRKQLEVAVRFQTKTDLLPPARVVCLIGQSGSGKTGLCVKLAAHFLQRAGLNVAWISADTFRASAIAEARFYAETLGLPLGLAYTPQDLAQRMSEAEDADLVLVDTPGCNPYKETKVLELASFLTKIPNRWTALVAPANIQEEVLIQANAAFGPLCLKGLMVTKMDETSSLGSIYNLAWKTQLPLAYYSNGTDVFEDLAPADPNVLVSHLLGSGNIR